MGLKWLAVPIFLAGVLIGLYLGEYKTSRDNSQSQANVIKVKDAEIATLTTKLATRTAGKYLGKVTVAFQDHQFIMDEYIPDEYGAFWRNWPSYACVSIAGERGRVQRRFVVLADKIVPVRDVK